MNVKGTDTLHPPSRHCAIMSLHHKVVSGRPSKLYVVSFSKTAPFGRELGVFSSKASMSLAVREKASLGSDMVMSEMEVEVTGERRDSRVMSGSEMTGWGVVMIGKGTRVVIGVDMRAFFLNFAC